jgi:hypothetical protein
MAAENHPTIEFQCPATGTPITLAFGYLHGEAMMPIWIGEDKDIVAMIPRQVLVDVLRDGWSDTEAASSTCAATIPKAWLKYYHQIQVLIDLTNWSDTEPDPKQEV